MDAEATLFEAVIVPHRSLSRRGLGVLAGAIVALSMTVTAVFWWLGAWPVALFNGVEISTALLLMRHHARAVRATEVLLLSPSALRIVRTGLDGVRTERRLAPAWLRLELQERKGRVPGLYLATRGERVEVAASLGEAEKLSLADALRTALEAWQRPVFDNPQLR